MITPPVPVDIPPAVRAGGRADGSSFQKPHACGFPSHPLPVSIFRHNDFV